MYSLVRRSPTVAMFIDKCNTGLIIVLAILAVIGIIAIFNKRLRGKTALFAFCVAALVAFALEATAFNFLHYLKYFAGPPTVITGVSETDKNILLTTDDAYAELLSDGVRFKNLNRKVTSVFVDMEFNNIETAEMVVKWTDEGITQQYVKKLYKYLPHENYAPLQPCGNVSELTVTFNARTDQIIANKIMVNKPIPFYFSGLRLLVVSFFIFAIFAIVNKTLRAKAAYWLFEYKFDPKNVKQNIIYACTVALLILFSWVCVFTSVSDYHEWEKKYHIYNEYLVDALINGRTYLEYGNPQLWSNVERPYDDTWRKTNGYEEVTNYEAFDWTWYKGRYYCYFGVVPAVILYIPYKLITGEYLPNHVGTFLFCAITVILLALLWRYCVKKYMQDMRYAHYLFSFITLFFASGIGPILRYATFYTIVQAAGLMFTVAGVLLLLKSVDNEKISHLKLFFACLCFALIFGCRPSMGLASLLVPVVLWRHRTWKLFAFAMFPYVIVAIPLCLYNYVRFGSIFEFGVNYVLTNFNINVFAQQNVLGKMFRTFVSSANYLFCPLKFSLKFPFIELWWGDSQQISQGILWNFQCAMGIINFPIVFSLFYLFKNKINRKHLYLLSAFLIIGIAVAVLNSIAQGCAVRYMPDIAVFIIFPSLFCAYYWCQDSEWSGIRRFIGHTVRLSVTYVLIAASIFVGLFLFVVAQSTYSNPTLYRYLEYSLGVIRNV